jgi:hypothetical protein
VVVCGVFKGGCLATTSGTSSGGSPRRYVSLLTRAQHAHQALVLRSDMQDNAPLHDSRTMSPKVGDTNGANTRLAATRIGAMQRVTFHLTRLGGLRIKLIRMVAEVDDLVATVQSWDCGSGNRVGVCYRSGCREWSRICPVHPCCHVLHTALRGGVPPDNRVDSSSQPNADLVDVPDCATTLARIWAYSDRASRNLALLPGIVVEH